MSHRRHGHLAPFADTALADRLEEQGGCGGLAAVSRGDRAERRPDDGLFQGMATQARVGRQQRLHIDGAAVTRRLRLSRHQLGKDVDGDDITSCTVERDFANIFVRPEPQGKDQIAAFRLIKTKLNASPSKGKARCPQLDPCITIEQSIASVADSLVTYQSNKRKNRARKIVDDLIKGGHFASGLEGDEGWLWLAP